MRLPRVEHPGRFAVVAVGALIVVNLAIWGSRSVTQSGSPERPTVIVALHPAETERILPQDAIEVDLDARADLQGQLYVDGTVIPEDETTGDPNLGQLVFAPGAGKTLRELAPGSHTAHVEYWPRTESREAATARHDLGGYSWTFKVG